MSIRGVSLAIASCLVLVACGGGGGGSGGPNVGVVTPTPPTTTPPDPCRPTALRCAPTFTGTPLTSARYTIDGGDGTPLMSLTDSGYTITLYTRQTLNDLDDAYVRDDAPRGPGTEGVVLIDFKKANDGLGEIRRTIPPINGRSTTIELYDDIAAAAGGLEYIQLGRMAGNITGKTSGYSYFALTTPEVAPIPTTGSATYVGETRGRNFAPSNEYNYRADIRAEVSFADRSLNGTVTNVRGAYDNGANVPLQFSDLFDFSARINPDRTITGAPVGRTSTAFGEVRGSFAGAHASGQPAELALSYNVGTLVGVAGLKRTGGTP